MQIHLIRPSNPTPRENDNNTELNKSSERPAQKEELTDMDKALKRMVDACRLCDSGEAARAAKKFKKVS